MSDAKINIHPSAVVAEGAVIGAGTAIWHFSHICSGADRRELLLTWSFRAWCGLRPCLEIWH